LHPAVGRCSVNFPKREASIVFTPDKSDKTNEASESILERPFLRLSGLVALLHSIGYEPLLNLANLERQEKPPTRHKEWLRIGIAGFAFGNAMLFSLPIYLGLDSLSSESFKAIFGWLGLLFALPALVYSASDYWRSAVTAARQRVLTLDVPIALGLAAIYAQSIYEVISGNGPGYCDSLTGLIFFLLCGRLFQKVNYDRLTFDRDYKSFFPLSVVRMTEKGEETVAISEISVGDRLRLRQGDLIPADSILLSRSACLNYSFVTGESTPVEKREGDRLYAGGHQVGEAIEVEIIKPVSQSYLTSLWNDEAFTKDREDNINTLTNRYSRRFTRIVLSVALASGLFWLITSNTAQAINAFTSVLIVACPCALALAAPFALGTAQRILAGMGVYLKNSLIIERLAQVDTIVFDKTGTLTRPANEVTFADSRQKSWWSVASGGTIFEGLSAEEDQAVYSVSRHSTHPLAVLISEFLGERHSAEPVRHFAEKVGCGIEGEVADLHIRLGSLQWLEDQDAQPAITTLPSGSTAHVAINGKYRGRYCFKNTLRPQIRELLSQLNDKYRIVLLSGDNETERARFEELFGTDAQLFFNRSPIEKLNFIRELQRTGKTVMMVGDGLNDAGALKQADVGVAVVEKRGAFSPASDAIFESRQVSELANISAFARQSARIVRSSFLVSSLYNAVGITIAAAGLLSPVVCAILMPLSSVSVVLFSCGATRWAANRTLNRTNLTCP
jgi:Cu+-exporting ATPase